jgi:hypothetical protein
MPSASAAAALLSGRRLFAALGARRRRTRAVLVWAAVALSNRRGQPFERAAAIRRAGRAAAPHAGCVLRNRPFAVVAGDTPPRPSAAGAAQRRRTAQGLDGREINTSRESPHSY